MIKVASCDKLSSLFLSEEHAFRLVRSEGRSSVERVLALLQQELAELGVVSTKTAQSPPPDLGAGAADLVLQHPRVEFISYPHEWCAPALRDAAVFHLDLSLRLLAKKLYLKDAHPWNILFEGGRPVFVDFCSIVDQEMLFSEDYLAANSKASVTAAPAARLALVVHEIFARMFVPYFWRPLVAYAYGNRALVPAEIERCTLNASTSAISWRARLSLRPLSTVFFRLPAMLLAEWRMRSLLKNLQRDYNVEKFFRDLRALVLSLPVTKDKSGYTDYYEAKGENQSHDDRSGWNEKQKTVAAALDVPALKTVLDVASNTGWFSQLASHLGKNVVAFDIDEACIERLYGPTRQQGRRILPLVSNFLSLSRDRFSIFDGQAVLLNAPDRLRCDGVMALAVIHHLVLGAGLSLEQVVEKLAALAKKRLILEFVDVSDSLIEKEPEFFPAAIRDPALRKAYSFEALDAVLRRHFAKVEVKKSFPDTRSILVCDK